MIILYRLATWTLLTIFACCSGKDSEIDLSGSWQVRLADGADWESVSLPGSLSDNRLGQPVGPETKWIGTVREGFYSDAGYASYRQANDNFKLPFWLQPDLRYVGAATYQRKVTIPKHWTDGDTELVLERPHWKTTVAIDGAEVGTLDSLSTPHRYDLSGYLSPGEHTLTIQVDNRANELDVGLNSHSVSDHTQSAWNGIVGEISIIHRPAIAAVRVDVFPNDSADSVNVRSHFNNSTERAVPKIVCIDIEQNGQVLGTFCDSVVVQPGKSTIEKSIELVKPGSLWSEFEPHLSTVTVTLGDSKNQPDPEATVRSSFGFRSLATRGNQWTINGSPLFLRGTLECCVFPKTGYPPTDESSWIKIIETCKAHGLNHIRFHSWCPPEAAFDAADKLGFYFQVECSSWPSESVALGENAPIDAWLYEEATRIVNEYGNHPSFLLLAGGNEAGGPDQGRAYLQSWVKYFDDLEHRVLVTGTSGWPDIDANQFLVTPQLRLHQWGDGLAGLVNAHHPSTMSDYRKIVEEFSIPVVSHEVGQWCAYPNLDEQQRYTGTLKAKNLDIFADFLRRAGLYHQASRFHLASGQLQELIYKEEVERCLRTPGLGGFQLLGLTDFPGQGSAIVGLLNAFWEPKSYFNSAKFRQCCGPRVLLARLPRRVWDAGELFKATVEFANFDPAPITGAKVAWQLVGISRTSDSKKVYAEGTIEEPQSVSEGLFTFGEIAARLPDVPVAEKLALRTQLIETTARTGFSEIENQWDLWVYPRETSAGPDDVKLSTQVHVTNRLDEETIGKLESGSRVLLLADPKSVNTNVLMAFSPVFWNSAWTNNQPPHTLGILCDPKHPAFQNFPTESHSNWQWWELVSAAAPMNLDRLSSPADPIVQVIPDWFRPQRLGLVAETQVGEGRLLLCSIDLNSDLAHRTVARQLRESLLSYVASDEFRPKQHAKIAELKKLFHGDSFCRSVGATVSASESHGDYPVAAVIDGDAGTFWHTSFSPVLKGLPQSIEVDLLNPVSVQGVRCLPRQDSRNGRIERFRVEVSTDHKNWTVAAEGVWGDHSARTDVYFEKSHVARYVRLVAVRAFGASRIASLAEFDVIPEPKAPLDENAGSTAETNEAGASCN